MTIYLLRCGNPYRVESRHVFPHLLELFFSSPPLLHLNNCKCQITAALPDLNGKYEIAVGTTGPQHTTTQHNHKHIIHNTKPAGHSHSTKDNHEQTSHEHNHKHTAINTTTNTIANTTTNAQSQTYSHKHTTNPITNTQAHNHKHDHKHTTPNTQPQTHNHKHTTTTI